MTMKGQLLEAFKEKEEWTIKELYAKFAGKPQASIRQCCNAETKRGTIERVKKGTYKIKVLL